MKGELALLERLLKALADGTRLRILGLLSGGEICVCDIHDCLKISQPKASRHLAYLRKAGLVTTRREGLWVHYALTPSVHPLVDTIQQAVLHAVGHVMEVQKDARRLQRTTGCCPTYAVGAPSYNCCQPPSPAARGRAASTTRGRI